MDSTQDLIYNHLMIRKDGILFILLKLWQKNMWYRDVSHDLLGLDMCQLLPVEFTEA